MKIIKKLNKRLRISDLEAVRVHFSWGMRFLFQVGFVVSWTILTALFVEQFGIQNLLLFFLFDAGLFIVGTILAGILLPKLSLRAFLLTTIGLTILFASSALLFSASTLLFFVLLILAKDLFFAQTSIALYRLTETFFSPAQAQRLMPFIESAITIGAVAGASLTLLFLNIFQTQMVLSLWIGALILMAGLMSFMPRILHSIPNVFVSEKKEISERPLAEALHGIRRTRFLKHILAVILLQSAVFTIIEFQFTKNVQSHVVVKEHQQVSLSSEYLQTSLFHEAKETALAIGHKAKQEVEEISSQLIMHKTLAHDLGMFHLIFAIFALFVQFLLTPRILKSFGIIGSISSYFFILLLTIGSVVLGYGSVNFLRMIQHGTHSIGESAYHISFYSLFSHRRESIRLFLEGIGKPIGIILGVVLIFSLPQQFIFFIALLAIAIGLVITLPLRRSFTRLSESNLNSDDLIEGKLHSIEVLGQKGHEHPAKILSEKLKNRKEHEIIREKIIHVISDIGDPRAVHTYIEILGNADENLETKIKILDSLCHLKIAPSYWEEHAFTRYHLLETLKDLFLKHEHAHIRKLIVMNIFQHLPSHEIAPFFLETMETSDEKLKSVYLRSCQMFSDPEIAFYVRKYLTSQNPRLQSHAVIALWKFENHKDLRKILYTLLSKEDEDSIVSGLYALGEVQDTKSLALLLDFAVHPILRIRLHALIALAKLGDTRCISGILEILFEADQKDSEATFHMLDRVSPDIRNMIQKEIQMEVSHRVFQILQKQTSSENFSVSLFQSLKRLYRMAERYDDLLAMERYSSIKNERA